MAEKKEKQYVSDNAQLMAEWDWEKNEDVLPEQVTLGSHRLVFWIGLCGHRWKAQIKSRSNGRGCPVCAGKQIVAGINDLASQRPDLAVDWHPTLNGDLKPTKVALNYSKKVWWKCHICGNEFYCTPNKRVSRNQGCSNCRKAKNKKVSK